MVFLDPEDGILRAVDNTVVTFKAHPATHAATGFLNGSFRAQANATFFKMPEYFLGRRTMGRTLVSRRERKMTEEQPVRGNNLGTGSIFKVMYGKIGIGRATQVALFYNIIFAGRQVGFR